MQITRYSKERQTSGMLPSSIHMFNSSEAAMSCGIPPSPDSFRTTRQFLWVLPHPKMDSLGNVFNKHRLLRQRLILGQTSGFWMSKCSHKRMAHCSWLDMPHPILLPILASLTSNPVELGSGYLIDQTA